MKLKVLVLLALAAAAHCASLGSEKCTYGPSYWCSHLDHAKECNAVQHCMDTVWKNQKQDTTGIGSDVCEDCVNVLSDVFEIVNNTKGQAVALIMETVCPKLGAFENLCEELNDDLFNAISQKLNPHDICDKLHMCDDQSHGSQSRAKLNKVMEIMVLAKQQTGVECGLCKSLAKEVQGILRDSTFQNELLGVVESVCARLPGDLGNKCKSYVAQYGPLVFQILVAELDPDYFCQKIGLCTKTEKKELTHVPRVAPLGTVQLLASQNKDEKVTGAECFLCELVMTELEKIITGDTTEEIETGLEKVCSHLPEKWKAECDKLVEDYTTAIIHLLVNHISPEKVCDALRLCTSATKLSAKLESPRKPVKSATECLVCEEVMGYVKSALTDETEEDEIVHILEKACTILPASYRKECDQLMSTYLPAILNMLAEKIDPNNICTGLGLCSSNAKDSQILKFQPMMTLLPSKTHVLGSEKCSYGPSFWCASRENAELCGMPVKHCVEQYGLKLDD